MTLFEFSQDQSAGEWHAINDGVMGGLSSGRIERTASGTGLFEGTVSLENNGGFASVRTVMDNMELNNYKGAAIRVKGDGNIYSLRFRTDSRFDGISYQAKFKTEEGQWQEYKIPFEEFTPVWRGRYVSDQPELTSEDIRQVGILIADKQFGEFELNIDWIKFY